MPAKLDSVNITGSSSMSDQMSGGWVLGSGTVRGPSPTLRYRSKLKLMGRLRFIVAHSLRCVSAIRGMVSPLLLFGLPAEECAFNVIEEEVQLQDLHPRLCLL